MRARDRAHPGRLQEGILSRESPLRREFCSKRVAYTEGILLLLELTMYRVLALPVRRKLYVLYRVLVRLVLRFVLRIARSDCGLLARTAGRSLALWITRL